MFVGNWLKKPRFLVLGLFVSFLLAFHGAMDNITIRHFIVSSDAFTSTLAYLIIGSWLGTVSGFILAKIIARKRLVEKNSKMHLFAFLAGLCSSVNMLCILLAYQISDTSVVTALTAAMVVYLAFYDVLVEKTIELRSVLIPVLGVVLGGILVSYNGSFNVAGSVLLLILVGANLFRAAAEIFEQEGVRNNVSDLTMGFWRLFWFAASITPVAWLVSAVRGLESELRTTLIGVIENGLVVVFIFATVSIAFVANVLRLNMKRSATNTAISTVLTTRVLFSYPIIFVWVFIWPNAFGDIPSSPLVWGIRLGGAILIMASVVAAGRLHTSAQAKK
jgi:hypothetical protein